MVGKDLGGRQVAERLLAFINASDTQFHAAFEASKRLLGAGFTQLSERQPWQLEKGGKVGDPAQWPGDVRLSLCEKHVWEAYWLWKARGA